MTELPPTVTELIDGLDGLYPNTCPSLSDEERLIWFKAGQRSVVNHLLRLRAFDDGEQPLFYDMSQP